jgi:uncharacterized membrane protein YjfL (UPF0719 family)
MENAILDMVISVSLVTAFLYSVRLFCENRMNATYNTSGQAQLESGNTAYSIFRSSMYIAMGIAMLGTINSDFLMQAGNGVLAAGFIYLAIILSDYVIFPNIDDRKEIIAGGNVAMALVLGAFVISTGIISYSSFMGQGPWWTSIVFFVVGQVILLVMSRVYELTHSNLLKNVEEGKVSSGILLGGMFIAFAMILNGAIAGDFVSIEADMKAIGISVGIGIFTMFIFVNQAIDRLFVPHQSIKEMIETDDIPAITIMTSLKIIIAMVIGYVVI